MTATKKQLHTIAVTHDSYEMTPQSQTELQVANIITRQTNVTQFEEYFLVMQ